MLICSCMDVSVVGFYFLKIFLGVVRCLLFGIAANGTLQPKTLAFYLYGHHIKVVF